MKLCGHIKGVNWVYVFYNPINMTYKIGHTNNVYTRRKTMVAHSGINIDVVYLFKFSDTKTQTSKKEATRVEKMLHRYYNKYRLRVDGQVTEWFSFSNPVARDIKTLIPNTVTQTYVNEEFYNEMFTCHTEFYKLFTIANKGAV